MRVMILAMLAMVLFGAAGCGTADSIRGGASDNGAHVRAKMGIPF